MAWTVSPQTLTVTPVLTTKTLPLVLKAAATPALPASVLSPRPPTVAMVTTSITKPESQNVPINLQVASKLTNQSLEPVRLVSKNAMVVSPPSPPCLADSVCVQFVFCSAEVIYWLFMFTWGFCRVKINPSFCRFDLILLVLEQAVVWVVAMLQPYWWRRSQFSVLAASVSHVDMWLREPAEINRFVHWWSMTVYSCRRTKPSEINWYIPKVLVW